MKKDLFIPVLRLASRAPEHKTEHVITDWEMLEYGLTKRKKEEAYYRDPATDETLHAVWDVELNKVADRRLDLGYRIDAEVLRVRLDIEGYPIQLTTPEKMMLAIDLEGLYKPN